MREASQASLTEAVKMTAGASLTRMVKGAAGREPWPIDDPASTDSPPKRRALPTLIAACLCLGALAALAFVGVRGTATTTTLAFPETAAAPRATVPRRVALVIGNSAYRYTARLANPHNDAFDISRALRRRSFHVIEGFDLDKASFDTSIAEFSAALKNAEVGLFFYAGHGIQVGGHNYLAPIDARLTVVSALDNEMVRLEIVQRAMAGGAATNLLFLDACRDNPLARNLARAMGTRSPEIGPGLAAVESGAGTLISFSTQPGNVALDGTGRNSPYSTALIGQLTTSTDDLNAILIAVRNDVMRQTDRRQVPWEHSALTRRFYFDTALATSSIAQDGPVSPSEPARAWYAIRETASIAVLDAFVTHYKDTFYAELARARIAELREQAKPSFTYP